MPVKLTLRIEYSPAKARQLMAMDQSQVLYILRADLTRFKLPHPRLVNIHPPTKEGVELFWSVPPGSEVFFLVMRMFSADSLAVGKFLVRRTAAAIAIMRKCSIKDMSLDNRPPLPPPAPSPPPAPLLLRLTPPAPPILCPPTDSAVWRFLPLVQHSFLHLPPPPAHLPPNPFQLKNPATVKPEPVEYKLEPVENRAASPPVSTLSAPKSDWDVPRRPLTQYNGSPRSFFKNTRDRRSASPRRAYTSRSRSRSPKRREPDPDSSKHDRHGSPKRAKDRVGSSRRRDESRSAKRRERDSSKHRDQDGHSKRRDGGDSSPRRRNGESSPKRRDKERHRSRSSSPRRTKDRDSPQENGASKRRRRVKDGDSSPRRAKHRDSSRDRADSSQPRGRASSPRPPNDRDGSLPRSSSRRRLSPLPTTGRSRPSGRRVRSRRGHAYAPWDIPERPLVHYPSSPHSYFKSRRQRSSSPGQSSPRYGRDRRDDDLPLFPRSYFKSSRGGSSLAGQSFSRSASPRYGRRGGEAFTRDRHPDTPSPTKSISNMYYGPEPPPPAPDDANIPTSSVEDVCPIPRVLLQSQSIFTSPEPQAPPQIQISVPRCLLRPRSTPRIHP
ncbi:hypothetical protein C8R46DRAFT_44404 [Mycena filopes]|nr:hypothetical protein C8R46DRAFT_44404 [Mycena filopes]